MKKLSFVACSLFISYALVIAQPFFQGEHIFELQDKHVHSSSIVECPNGDMLVCWFYGSGERTADDVLIQGSRLRKGTDQWEPVFLMADTPGFPDCNPVLFIDQGERLWMLWIVVLAHGWQNSILKYRIANEYQNSGPPEWSWQDILILKPGEEFAREVKDAFDILVTEEPMWAEYAYPYHRMIIEASHDAMKRQIGWMTRTHPLVLPSGRILLPLYSDGFNVGIAAISDDKGKNWRASLPMVGFGPIQPTIVRKKDGTLVAYMRDSGDRPYRVLKSSSQDEGLTWSVALDTDIPNPGSSLEVISVRDGKWVMVYNDTEEGRHSLAVSVSDDEGATWKWKHVLEKAERGKKSFAYPSLIQARDGKIHLTYSYKEYGKATIKHISFDIKSITQ